MSEYNEFNYSGQSTTSRYLISAYMHAESATQIAEWCYDNGAGDIYVPPSADAKLVVDNRFVDFYDEEMYVLFKLRWG